MKKLLCLLLVICLPVIALADVDLSSMSFDDLMSLRTALDAEIMSRPEWKEVTVPIGEWKVGDDIPVGSYSVIAPQYVCIYVYGSENDIIPDTYILAEGDSIGKLILKEGAIVKLFSPAIFAPSVGLGF